MAKKSENRRNNVSNKLKKEMAERMFIEEGMTAKAISAILDVSEQTLSRWRKGYEIDGEKSWDDRRAEFVTSPHKIREVLMRELKTVAEGGKSTVDADSLAKISKVLETISDRISIQVIFSVFKEFDSWMASQDPEVAIQFLEWHKMFLLHKAQQES